MRKTRSIFGRVLLFLLLFTTLTSSSIYPENKAVFAAKSDGSGDGQVGAEKSSGRPAGRWITSCDPLLSVIRIKWTSDIQLEGGIFVIESEFTDYSLRTDMKRIIPGQGGGSENSNVVAFKVMIRPETIALEIMSDGRLAPENTGFNQSVVAYAYPGGYDALVEDLNSHGIDWEKLYVELKSSAAEIRKSVDKTFCPSLQKRQEWPRTLTA